MIKVIDFGVAKAVVHVFQGELRRAMEIYQELKQQHNTWYMRARMIEIPLLIGEFEMAQQDAREWLKSSEGYPSEIRCERKRLEMVSNMRVPELAEGASPFETVIHKCTEGLMSIGHKDWKNAITQLEASCNAVKFQEPVTKPFRNRKTPDV